MKWIAISLVSLNALNLHAVENRNNNPNQLCDIEEMQMQEQANIQLVQKLLRGTLEEQNISTYDQIFAENIRMHGPFNAYEGDLNLSLAKEFDVSKLKLI